MQSVLKQNEPTRAELGYHPLPALEGEVVAGPGAEDLVPVSGAHQLGLQADGGIIGPDGMVAVRDHRVGLPAVPARRPRPRQPRETAEQKRLRLEVESLAADLQVARDKHYRARLRYEASGPSLPV